MTDSPIDPTLLERLAEVSVRTGLNLQPGQELVLTAPVTALPLVRAITRAAYAAGASLVTPLLTDSEGTLARFETAGDETFDLAPGWLYSGMAEAFDRGAARMAISISLMTSTPAVAARAAASCGRGW